MVFGAFRNGFKSGGFNTSGNTATLTADPSYKPEDAQGFEAGLKFQSRNVRLAATAYTYEYKNMQVSTFDPIRVAQLVTNAASARIKGIELEIDWRTPVDGLRVHAAGNYNHGRYNDFLVGCYTGQTIAAGCNVNPGSNGVFRQQDFAGKQLYLSPDWTGSAGFNYTTPVSDAMKLGFSGDAVYKSSYFADLEQAPLGKQKRSWMLSAAVRLADQDDRWEFAVIGDNLTEVYRSSLTAQVSLTGRSAFTGTNSEGGLADLNGQINRGRQVRAQFTYRFR
jgi:iron complex outermembrane receptor protein